jgi:hypothetical protein
MKIAFDRATIDRKGWPPPLPVLFGENWGQTSKNAYLKHLHRPMVSISMGFDEQLLPPRWDLRQKLFQ